MAKVYDQYLNFITLSPRLFSLGLRRTYVQLHDPAAKDAEVEAAVGELVSGLFCVLVTLGAVPIIRAARGGAAEMVAARLDARLREHLQSRSNLFSEAAAGPQAGGQRPLLCLFDRNFELASAVQHVWSYQPLVGDVLGMRLNRINISGPASASAPAGKKSFELDGETDPFWEAHQAAQFPKVGRGLCVGAGGSACGGSAQRCPLGGGVSSLRRRRVPRRWRRRWRRSCSATRRRWRR